MIVLGIDPGLSAMGWGVVESPEQGGRDLVARGHGALKTASGINIAERLRHIFEELGRIIAEYKPDELAIEEIFFEKNVKTAVVVAQSKGTALTAAGVAGLRAYEYSPVQIKLALAGYGKADKEQVQKMVQRLLGLAELPRPNHAADALAVAITHIHHQRLERRAAKMDVALARKR